MVKDRIARESKAAVRDFLAAVFTSDFIIANAIDTYWDVCYHINNKRYY